MKLLLPKVNSFPFVVQLALVISLLAMLGLVLVHIVLVMKRLNGDALERKRQKLIKQFEELSIPHVILNPDIGYVPVSAISLPLGEYRALGLYDDAQIRNCFTGYLMNMSDNLSGKVHVLIRKLYNDLALGEYAKSMLYSGRRDIVLGLHQLSFFNVGVDRKVIDKLLNHPDKLVREKATCYALKMFPEPMTVLPLIREGFSTWTMVDYFEIIKNRKDVESFSFAEWIQPGNNKSVVLLCVNLAVYFQQVDAGEAILAMLDHAGTDFKKKLINSVGRLFYPQLAPAIEQRYSAETDTGVKKELLKALGRLGNEQSIPFLQEKFKTESNVVLKKHAAYSLYCMNVNRDALMPLYTNASGTDNEILGYIQNPLIKYI